MADIHVVFQKNKPAFVLEDPEAVMQDEILNWHFHTAKTPVRRVRIVFSKRSAAFFPHPGKKATNTITRDVVNGQTIWGRAPRYFKKGPPRSRPDKYTIEAFDGKGKKLVWATNDPTIRTDGP
jgi:hypothetical protein